MDNHYYPDVYNYGQPYGQAPQNDLNAFLFLRDQMARIMQEQFGIGVRPILRPTYRKP